MNVSAFARLIGGTVLTACASTGAWAQDRVPTATGSSERAAFQAQGFPAGAFRIYPTLRLSTTYNDSTRAQVNGASDDIIFSIAPSVTAQSQWANNALSATAFLQTNTFAKRSELNTTDFGASADGRLDVRRTWTIRGSGGYARLHEIRGTVGDLLTSNRYIEFDRANGALSISEQINRVAIAVNASAQQYRFQNVLTGGVLVDQTFRDRNVFDVGGRVSYQYSAVTSVFAGGSVSRIRYDRLQPGLLDRGSDGFSGLAGVHFELSRLLRGEVGFGYIQQRFRDPRFAAFNGFNYNASFSYQPTALTSFSFAATRRLTDSALQNVGGVLASQFEVSVDHELLRNVSVAANIGYINYEYRGIDRTDRRFTYGAGARYKLNRYLSAALSYDRTSVTSVQVGPGGYDSDRGTLSIIASR